MNRVSGKRAAQRWKRLLDKSRLRNRNHEEEIDHEDKSPRCAYAANCFQARGDQTLGHLQHEPTQHRRPGAGRHRRGGLRDELAQARDGALDPEGMATAFGRPSAASCWIGFRRLVSSRERVEQVVRDLVRLTEALPIARQGCGSRPVAIAPLSSWPP